MIVNLTKKNILDVDTLIEYQRIIPYLIEAIKEQQKQIDQLKSDVKTLMSK